MEQGKRPNPACQAQGPGAMFKSLGELPEVVGQGTAYFSGEEFGERGDGAGRLVEGDAFDAQHGKEQSGEASAFAFGAVDLIDEVVEGVEVNAAQRDARGVDGEEFAPEFFFGGM